MAAVTAPARGSLLGKISGVFAARARSRGRGASKVAAFVGDHVTTVAALAAADTGLWHLGPVEGWVAVGVSLLIAEFKVRG